MTDFHDKAVEITVTRSAGTDGAVVVFIDTPNWEPNGTDGGPGLRVLINDYDTYVGIPHRPTPDDSENDVVRECKLIVPLDSIEYGTTGTSIVDAAWDPLGIEKHRYYEEN